MTGLAPRRLLVGRHRYLRGRGTSRCAAHGTMSRCTLPTGTRRAPARRTARTVHGSIPIA